MGPMPGMAASILLTGLALCRALSFASKVSISLSSLSICWARNATMSAAACGMSAALATAACNLVRPAGPCAVTMPNSLAWPRMALTSWVRCRTASSRTPSAMVWACCSADLTGTKRMVGRLAASLMASASLRSFLLRLTKGLTYCGGIRRTVCPAACNTRPQ